MSTYELWDTNSFNLVDEFETESAALDAACELIALNRSVYPEGLAPAHGDGRETVWLASGSELLQWIQRDRPLMAMQSAVAHEQKATRAATTESPVTRGRAVLSAGAPQSRRIAASGASQTIDKRERIDTSPGQAGGARYIRRDQRGRFTTDRVDVGRSLAPNRRRKAKAPKGRKDRGD